MTEPICTCGLDSSPDGLRYAIVCLKHDLPGIQEKWASVAISPVTVVVPKPLGTEIWDEQRDEALREEGRREVLREIAAMTPDSSLGDMGRCNFCGENVDWPVEYYKSDDLDESRWVKVGHLPTCLWLRAQSVKA